MLSPALILALGPLALCFLQTCHAWWLAPLALSALGASLLLGYSLTLAGWLAGVWVFFSLGFFWPGCQLVAGCVYLWPWLKCALPGPWSCSLVLSCLVVAPLLVVSPASGELCTLLEGSLLLLRLKVAY